VRRLVETILGAVGIIVMGLLVVNNIYLRLKNRKLFVKASQAEVDRLSVYVQTKELLAKAAEESQGTDGFIKFMSTSRDWAFEYIEDVQRDLHALKEVVDATAGKPRTVAQNNVLAEAVNKVLKHLPKEGK
jgi:ferritin